MTITKTQQIDLTRKIFKILGGEKNVYNLFFDWNGGDGLEFHTGIITKVQKKQIKKLFDKDRFHILIENSKLSPLEPYHPVNGLHYWIYEKPTS
jgi:hypothetical protein